MCGQHRQKIAKCHGSLAEWPTGGGQASELTLRDETMQAKVLLIGENPQGYSRLVKCLEGYRCKCRFATTYQEAVPLLGIKDFDLVLSPMRVRDGSVFPLISLLENSRTTLFYFQPVEAGCWWLPALRFGRNCFGSYALRPSEFIASLNLVMEEIQKGPSPMTTSQSLRNTTVTHCAPMAQYKICNCQTGPCRASGPGKIYCNWIEG